MTIVIEDIMKLLKVDEKTAERVENEILCFSEINFSECTKREFNREVRTAFETFQNRKTFKNGKEFFAWFEKNDEVKLTDRLDFLIEDENTIYSNALQYLQACEEG